MERQESSAGRRAMRVLVVDDSAVVRQFMSTLLSRQRGLEAAVAADPIIARHKLARWRPDVILLDLEMPRMDGLTFLRQLMAEDEPIPVVVFSGHAGRGTETAFRALDEGAVEVLAKPRIGVREFLRDASVVLVDTLRAAAQVRPRYRRQPLARLTADAVLPREHRPSGPPPAETVVAIGASTGGVEALHRILGVMPADAPGIVAVQHMPEGFTAAFARRLDQGSGIEVKEAADGDQVARGRALLAPGNRHLTIIRDGGGLAARLVDGPLVARHRPSVDVLFRSVARAAGAHAVGVILTGMGDDGAQGLYELKQTGAATIAQDEPSCAVFGMPKEAISRGAVDQVIGLAEIPAALLRKASGGSG